MFQIKIVAGSLSKIHVFFIIIIYLSQRRDKEVIIRVSTMHMGLIRGSRNIR